MNLAHLRWYWEDSPDTLRDIADRIMAGEKDHAIPLEEGQPVEEVRELAASYLLANCAEGGKP